MTKRPPPCAYCLRIREERGRERRRAGSRRRARERASRLVPEADRVHPPRKAFLCPDCALKRAAHAKALDTARAARRRARHVKAGLCNRCRSPRTEGAFCAVHAASNRAEKRLHDQRRAKAGLCERCTKPRVDGKLCARHAKAHRRYMRDYQRGYAKRAA